jgi:phage terminase large subunit GpA-like protein
VTPFADGYRRLCSAAAGAIRPRLRPAPSAWASRFRRLTGKSAAEPGPWRNERIPYLSAVMDALDPRHPSPVVVLCKSSQVGGSECALNWIGCTIHSAPGSILCLFPTEKVARKWVRTRLDSMIATTPELRALLPLGRNGSSGTTSTLAEKHFPGGVLFTGSANIPDDVASVSVPYLIFDEVDRMPAVLDDEGDPIDLALRRSTTFPRSKALFISTPTTADGSRIWPLFEASTQHRYLVPCPHCGELQTLEWSGLKWIDGRPSTAAYECRACAALIEERAKTDMLAAGHWHSAHPEREAEATGFHVSGLYTPVGLGDSWAKHAAAWERARGKPAREQVFYNTRLGVVHRGERVTVDWQTLFNRRESYRLRAVPPDVLLLTSGTDVQANRVETQVIGWCRGERAVVLDYAVHFGDPTRPDVWAELDAYLLREFEHSFGARMRLACSLVDAGYLPDEVLQFTRTRERVARNVYASRGSTVAARLPIGRPSLVDVRHRGQLDKRGAERYEIGVTNVKHWLFERLRSDEGKPDAPVLPSDRHMRFSDELPEEYFKQLTAETFDPKKGWIARANYHRNEALDTLVLCRAAALHHRVALHRMREPDFERLEAGLRLVPVEGKLGRDAIAVRGGFLPTSARVNNDTQ